MDATYDNRQCRRLAEALLPVALAAGRVQMAHHKSGVTAQAKADQSPVTIADHQSEEIILEALARVAPDIPVIAEEAVTAGRIPKIDGTFFLVDPLDGTKGFIRGRAEFTINIGLIFEGRPAFGLLYAPALSDFYVTLGSDEAVTATLDPHAEVADIEACRPRRLRTSVPDPHALRALTSQTHLNSATQRFLDGYNVVDRRAVSSSLKFGLIAKGEADVYPRVGPTSEWDTAAGHALLAAAGGTVTALDGSPLTYGNRARQFVNPDFVAWARQRLPRTRVV
jgi:3'(2'), 5'-bisphosphate nucleotidase